METIQLNRIYNINDLNNSGLEYRDYNLVIHDELINEFKSNNPNAIVEGADGSCVVYGENEFNYVITVYYTTE